MKVVMILPPQITVYVAPIAVLSAGTEGVTTVAPFNIFLDMQANVVDLQDSRYLVEHPVPGREGGIHQDMGSPSATLSIQGKWIYENKPHKDIVDILGQFITDKIAWNWIRLQTLRLVMKMKTPLVLACDLLTTLVLIKDMRTRHVGGQPNVYEYQMVLKEYNPMLTVLGLAGVAAAFSVIPLSGEVGR